MTLVSSSSSSLSPSTAADAATATDVPGDAAAGASATTAAPAPAPADDLLFCVAHGRTSSPATLDRILDETADLCRKHSEEDNTLHLVVTGSLHIPTPGKELPDWQGHWSAGEHVLAQLIKRIGLNAFAALKRHGRVHARLLDINWKTATASTAFSTPAAGARVTENMQQKKRLQDETGAAATTNNNTDNNNDDENNNNNSNTMTKPSTSTLIPIIINGDPSLSFAVHELCRFLQRRKILALGHATVVLPVAAVDEHKRSINDLQEEREKEHDILKLQFRQVWDAHWEEDSPMRRTQFEIVPVDPE